MRVFAITMIFVVLNAIAFGAYRTVTADAASTERTIAPVLAPSTKPQTASQAPAPAPTAPVPKPRVVVEEPVVETKIETKPGVAANAKIAKPRIAIMPPAKRTPSEKPNRPVKAKDSAEPNPQDRLLMMEANPYKRGE
jgi:hypothetical protein